MPEKEGDKDPDENTIKCPGCNLRLPKHDTDAQVAHMDKHHPEIIARRLKENSV